MGKRTYCLCNGLQLEVRWEDAMQGPVNPRVENITFTFRGTAGTINEPFDLSSPNVFGRIIEFLSEHAELINRFHKDHEGEIEVRNIDSIPMLLVYVSRDTPCRIALLSRCSAESLSQLRDLAITMFYASEYGGFPGRPIG